ncbi:MAG: hypothetical protein C5B58_00710 [Acidobacteria bacterium]|nr:MAG: hypothetical protein C5B58_00710 [Acidobacteriota bacterium]
MSREELSRFGEWVESLEMTVDCLAIGTSARTRQALISLDNLAEVLMFEMCESLFKRDEFFARFMPPQFSSKQKAAIRWGFHEKLELLESEGRVTREEAIALRILHRYRTPAFHRHLHNPRSGWVVTFVALPAVVRLLSGVFLGMSMGGFSEPIEWLAKYGLPSDYVNFEQAAREVGNGLLPRIERDQAELIQTLTHDIATRVSDLERLALEELFSEDPVVLDEFLRREEFWIGFDDAKASAPHREVLYAITTKAREVTKEEFQRSEADYRARVADAANAFRGSLSMEGLRHLGSRAATLGPDVLAALESYVALDEQVAQYEKTLEMAAERLDQAVQAEIDRRRGK